MLSLLRQRNYGLLWFGGAISQIGTFMLTAALPYYIYATSRSVTASGAAIVSEIIPGILFNTIGGVYADRLPRKLALALGNGTRGLLILPLLAVHGPSTLWIVYVVGFCNQTVAALAGPFGSAAMPHIVSAEDLPAANGAFSVASNIGMLAGSPLGGLVLQQFGLSAVVLIDAVSFIIPTVAILLINVPLEDRRQRKARHDTHLRVFLREWVLGLQYARRTPVLARLIVLVIPGSFATGIYFVIFTPFVRQILGGSAEFYSWTVTAQAVSSIAGGAMVGVMSERVGLRALVAGSLLGLGVISLIEILAVSRPVTIAVSLGVGFLSVFIGASMSTLLQNGVEDAYRGRAYGTYISASGFMLFLGTAVTTVITDRIGIRIVFASGSLILLLAGATAMKVLPATIQGPHTE